MNHDITRRSFLRVGVAAAVAAAAPMPLLTACSHGASGSTGTSSSSSSAGEAATTTFFNFDTVITIKAYCDSELLDQLQQRCNYFEGIFSRTIEGSDISNINEAQGAPVAVAEETADIISKALVYCQRSDGLFDITIGAATTLWDFDAGIIPDPDELAEAIKHIDYRTVSVEGTTVTLADPAAKLDLGGIAKGYIADDLAGILRDGGCTSAMINLGGNIYVVGDKPSGDPWNIGIQDPNNADGAIIAQTKAADLSVVTSGLYERQFEKDGVVYYHILDPKTGYPVKTDLESSSILSVKSIDGDAYSTWTFLLGSTKALALVESTEGMEAMVVDDSGGIEQTSGNKFTVS